MSWSALAELNRLAGGAHDGRLRHTHLVPPRPAAVADLPSWTPPELASSLAAMGVSRLWRHQREAAEAAYRGEHVVLSTGTASGKSLGYLIPALTHVLGGLDAPSGRGASVLYFTPTKALAQDQLAAVERLSIPGIRPAVFDGDTPPHERRWARDHANYVLTNPDLVHHSLLPGHHRWASFLRALRLVVIDECHVYRGVFGSHMAGVVRRLRRVAQRYQATPTFVLASATAGEPAAHASRLIGMPVHAIAEDSSPRGGVVVGLWEPPSGPADDAPTTALTPAGDQPVTAPTGRPRRSTLGETAALLAQLVGDGVQTVAFARSRAGAEVVAAAARRRLATAGTSDTDAAVVAYRGGYLPEDRRRVERDLRSGRIRGVAATTALELGIDVHGLGAVLVAGWPGSRSGLWQRIGRAGRAGQDALAVLVAADDPLDTYLLGHPEVVFDAPLEATVLDPDNPHVLAPHLAAAAAELPLRERDLDLFGPSAQSVVEALTARRLLRRRPKGWYWARHDRPTDHASLRGLGEAVRIVDRDTGRVVGTVDDSRAHTTVHTGAVYLHQGETWLVVHLDVAEGAAVAVRGDPGWVTRARAETVVELGVAERARRWGAMRAGFGPVRVSSQVTSFRRMLPGGRVLGQHELDLPVRTLSTKGVWWTLPEESLAQAGVGPHSAPGALHAAEHAAIGMLPLVATADRWDVGGISTTCHPDTGLATIVVYDGYPGGAGFAERGYEVMSRWLAATREAVATCGCREGCPACVHSPTCGNGNEPLDKAGAVAVLTATLLDAGADTPSPIDPETAG